MGALTAAMDGAEGLLAQDMLLVGPPGPARRRLALAYAEAPGREVEVIALTQDTSESDLKQRREISDGTSRFTTKRLFGQLSTESC